MNSAEWASTTSLAPYSPFPLTNSSSSPPLPPPPPSASSVQHMRLALTITHLLLVSLGSVNLLVILVILVRPYMRSITNVYMISLCLADFIYLTNLTLVAASQLNDKSWPFSSFLCTMYHGTETTGKYASVMFVVLLAVDRYCAMCRSNWCARYRNYRTAVALSLVAWLFAGISASPLYFFAEVAFLRLRSADQIHKLCIAKWPNSDVARWYITASSILIFALPLAVIIFCYYHILIKLREALKSCKRLKRGASSRAPYHRVTRLVLWVVVFHVLCWSPFWLFNLFSSIFRLRIATQFDRIVVNIIHLFPYINCALNPILYVAHAENFRVAFRSLFCPKLLLGGRGGGRSEEDSRCGVLPGGGNGTTSLGVGNSIANGSNGVGGLGNGTGGGGHQAGGVGAAGGRNAVGFLRYSSVGSERALLSTTAGACLTPANGGSSICINGVTNGGGGGGSAPSLLLDRPPMRANSAKHSVITIEDGPAPMVRQISWRRRSSAYEQGLLCGGGMAAASTVPFVTRVIQEEEKNTTMTTTKRNSLAEKSLLDEINAAEELPSAGNVQGGEKRTSICFFSIGITAGTIGGTTKLGGGKGTTTTTMVKTAMERRSAVDGQEEEGEEEEEGDEFI